MDANPQAAARFYRLVRDFSESATAMTQGVVRYDVKPDEAFDAGKISYRVYGRWDEYLAIMAAAGNDTIDQEIEQQQLVLPSAELLLTMKRNAGFESVSDYRENGVPTWSID